MQRHHTWAAALLLSVLAFTARAGETVTAADERTLLGPWVSPSRGRSPETPRATATGR